MEALKKAERAKQGYMTPHEPDSGLVAGRSPLVGHMAPHEPEPAPGRDAPEQIHQPDLELEVPSSLAPDLRLEPHADADNSGAFPLIIAAHDIPDRQDPAPSARSGTHTEPAPATPELTLNAYDLSSPGGDRKSESPGGAYDLSSSAEDKKSGPFREETTHKPADDSHDRPAIQSDTLKNPGPQHTPNPLRGESYGAAHKASAQQNENVSAARQKARSVFTAKQPASSRKLLIAGASLAIAASIAGSSAYYWPIISSNIAALTSGQAPIAALPTPRVTAPITPAPNPSNADSTQTKNASIAIAPDTGKGDTAPALQPASPKKPARTPRPSPPVTTAAQASTHDELEPVETNDSARTSARGESGPSGKKPAIQIRQNAATNQVNPTLSGAYQSFISGNIEMAQQQYHKVLQQEPNNRDALLGLAAVALNRKQPGQAAAYYAKLLELDPSDPDALAGLVGSQGQADPVQSESRLKMILAQNPENGALHFALGNLYSQQSHWAEAQQAYFRAYSSTPDNANYAFNLAISLEHLNQSKLALDYYQRALAQNGPANFDKSLAQRRIRELQKFKDN